MLGSIHCCQIVMQCLHKTMGMVASDWPVSHFVKTSHNWSKVPPESIYPFTGVLLQPICRLTPRSHLGNDAACRNFTEVVPRFAAT